MPEPKYKNDPVTLAGLASALKDGWTLLDDIAAIKERYRYGDGINAPRAIMTFDIGTLIGKYEELEEQLATAPRGH